MAENKTKRKAGIVLLIIGMSMLLIMEFLPFIFQNWIAFPIISVISIFIGFILLYKELSIKNRAIMLLITGGFFIIITTLMIIRITLYMYMLIILLTVNFALWILVFIIPSIIKLIKNINFSERTTYIYALAPLTVFWLLLYTIIISILSASTPTIFIDFYFQYFFIALGGGILLSIILLVIVYVGPTL
ncbi:MAG: hypothetical protein ACFFBH_12015 [Promethearchaeota archaeon]